MQSAIPEVDLDRSGATIDSFTKMSQAKHALMFYLDASATENLAYISQKAGTAGKMVIRDEHRQSVLRNLTK